MLEDEYIELYTYNYETIIAEKLQTILTRSTANSRMKDFYDLYYFVTYKWNDINVKILKDAIETTFEHRGTKEDLEKIDNILALIEENDIIHIRWKSYQDRFLYAKNIEFSDIINAIKQIKNI